MLVCELEIAHMTSWENFMRVHVREHLRQLTIMGYFYEFIVLNLVSQSSGSMILLSKTKLTFYSFIRLTLCVPFGKYFLFSTRLSWIRSIFVFFLTNAIKARERERIPLSTLGCSTVIGLRFINLLCSNFIFKIKSGFCLL